MRYFIYLRCLRYLIHCKNFCKCYNVPPPSTIIFLKKIKNLLRNGQCIENMEEAQDDKGKIKKSSQKLFGSNCP
jgi:hypothetical protein